MNHLIENNSNSRKGIIILITTQITFILLYIQYTYEKRIRNENINFSSEKKRNLSFFNFAYTKEDYIRDYQRKTIFSNIIPKYYEGTWETLPSKNIKNNKYSKYNKNNFKVGKSSNIKI